MKIKTLIAICAMALAFTNCKKEETKPEEPAPVAPNYTNFKITSIKINSIPMVDGSGASWDISNGADLFFNIEDVNSNVLFNGSGSVSNDVTTSQFPISWNFTSSYNITNTSIAQYITVYDYDTADPNDLIGYIGFIMDNHKSGYPTSITKTSGSLSITIVGSWY